MTIRKDVDTETAAAVFIRTKAYEKADCALSKKPFAVQLTEQYSLEALQRKQLVGCVNLAFMYLRSMT